MMRDKRRWIGVGIVALLVLGGCGGDGAEAVGGAGGSGGSGGAGGAPECDGAEMCEDENECTADVCTVDGVCENTPVADETPCNLGICVTGSCEPIDSVFPCTEQGIRDAVALGGGPYGFACDGPQTVITEAEISITNDVILDGLGRLTVDGNDEHRLFSVPLRPPPQNDGATVELRRFTFTRGTASEGSGGAILSSGTLALVDSEVSASVAETFGGGITNFGGVPNSGEMTIIRSAVSGNRSGGNGGGIMNTGVLTITDTTVAGNVAGADGNGGGIMNTGSLAITGCTISGNEAMQDGGGVANFNVLMLVNNTMSGNTANAGEGGGIWNNGVLTLSNGTVSANAAAIGGAIGNGGVARMVLNTLIDGECSGTGIESDGHNLESPGNTCGLNDPTDASGVSASILQLEPLQDNGGPTETHALGAGSVAIDVIPESDCVDANGTPLTADQRGEPRPAGTTDPKRCDVGAFEVQP